MTVPQIIQFLRLNVNVQNPDGSEGVDSAYLSMTDEDILLYLNVVLTRDFADIPSLEYLPAQNVYPLVLLAKKELYYALAVASANEYDLGADNNNYLKRSQRFEHYMKLIEQVAKSSIYPELQGTFKRGKNWIVTNGIIVLYFMENMK